MRKSIAVQVAALALSVIGPAHAADLAVAPTPFAERFNWTSCYGGMHLGGGFATKNMTDPVQLVQDNAGPGGTVGVTTVNPGPSGAVIGGQIGCDYQFTPSWVLGVEGATAATTNSATGQFALQNPGDSEAIALKTDLVSSVTGRLGYAVDHWLLYGKGGVAWASNKYSITGSYTGIPFDAEGQDVRLGWTAGAGVEWAFAEDWSARLEYDYYDFGRNNVLMIDGGNGGTNPGYNGPVSFRQTMQTVKLGVNFHVWGWQ